MYGHAIEFAADGRRLVTAEPTRVRVFDLALQQRAAHIADARVTAMRDLAQPDRLRRRRRPGARLAGGHVRRGRARRAGCGRPRAGWGRSAPSRWLRTAGVVAATIGNSVRLYSAESARLRDGPVLTGHDGPVTGVAFSPDGQTRRVELGGRRRSASGRAAPAPRRRRCGRTRASPRSRSRPTGARSPAPRPAARSACGTSRRAARSGSRCPRPARPISRSRPTTATLVAGGSPLERWSGQLWARTPDAIAGRSARWSARSLSRAEWRAAVTDRPWRATCE